MLSVIDSSFTAAELSCNEILEINYVAEATKAHFKSKNIERFLPELLPDKWHNYIHDP